MTRKRTLWYAFTLASLLPLVVTEPASAAFLAGGYAQNFDILGPSGTSLQNAGIPEWSVYRYNAPGFDRQTWTNATGIPAAQVGGGQFQDDTQNVNQQNLGLFYNPAFPTFTRAGGINAGHSTDPNDPNRALGTSPTNIAGNALQLTLTNDTGRDITGIHLSYDTLVLSDATATNELTGYRLFFSTTGLNGNWIAAPNLDTITNSTDPAFTIYTRSGNIALGSPLVNGGSIMFRWVDDNDQFTSPDQMLAIDNVTALEIVPVPPTFIAMGFGGLVAFLMGRAGRRTSL